jgi:UDP-N-acetylglucosamine 4,6-dehydratase
MRYFIGDARDADRLRQAMRGIDYVVHASALKQVLALAVPVGTGMGLPTSCLRSRIISRSTAN